MKTDARERIVIVGGGFAGVSAYRALTKRWGGSYDVLLISDDERFTHIPLIHETATAALPDSAVSWPLETYIACPENEMRVGRVVSVDADKRVLVLERAAARSEISFDYLVLATGSVPSLPDISGAREYLMTLRTRLDAQKIRETILLRFSEAEKTDTEEVRRALTTFVCIGAGVTGIELVGELSNLCAHELARRFPRAAQDARIVLLNRGERIEVGGHPWFGARAQQRLKNLPCVEVVHSADVSEVSSDGVRTADGFISARTVIWTGGVSGARIPITERSLIVPDSRGRIAVTPELHLAGNERVFIVGDLAQIPMQGGGSYGMQAQFAVREGRHAAKNIKRIMRGERPLPFVAKPKGFLMPVGKHYALAELFGFKFSGVLAWHLTHIIYVFSVVRWDLKLQVAWRWLYYLLRHRQTV